MNASHARLALRAYAKRPFGQRAMTVRLLKHLYRDELLALQKTPTEKAQNELKAEIEALLFGKPEPLA